MTQTQRTAELIPFDSVHRLVQERRQRKAVLAAQDEASLTAARTSQVRRLLTQQRSRSESGPEVA